MTNLPHYDQRALEVARAMVSVIGPEDAFLFGSRARGDWSDTSDIDVFTIAEHDADTKVKYQLALKVGRDQALAAYGRPVKIDLVRFSPAEFHYYRQAKTHLACSALKDGINMYREATGYGNQYRDVELNNWPDVETRFTNYQRQVFGGREQFGSQSRLRRSGVQLSALPGKRHERLFGVHGLRRR